MDNSRFSSLIYKIIGKPERWHDDYIDVMNQILDETESFDDPQNFSDLAVGDQILSRLRDTNDALTAFSTLLDKSRFKMIILDKQHVPIYHNQNAKDLHDSLLSRSHPQQLNQSLLNSIKTALSKQNDESLANRPELGLIPLDYPRANDDQIYLRTTYNRHTEATSHSHFYLLLVLDQSRQQSELNAELVSTYELTDKEELVLLKLIHGKSIKTIAEESFVSANTIKTHLKAIFRKTDTKSQTEVVRLILTHESQILDSYFDSTGLPDGTIFESAKDQQVTLADGHNITYREYGPANGHTVIVFHNSYGCRITIPPGHEGICARTNRRVIILDRPGFGRTPVIEGHPEHWSQYFTEFINLLNITEFDILGTVLGCPIALEVAAQSDHRLKRLILASPILVNQQSDTQYLLGILSPAARLVSASKRFAKEIYQLWLKSVTLNVGKHYRTMLESSLGSAERIMFAEQQTLDLMIQGFKESSSGNLDAIAHEMTYCLSPRKIDLSAVQIPVDLWWGTEDNRLSRAGAENLAQQLPNARLNIQEGYSEYIYYAKFEQMIA